MRVLKNDEDIYVIDVEGELDLPNSNELKELIMKMIEQKIERFIINMANVSSIDSSGLGALANISSTVGKLNFHLALSNVNESVRKALKNAKLTNYIHITCNTGDAVSFVRR